MSPIRLQRSRTQNGDDGAAGVYVETRDGLERPVNRHASVLHPVVAATVHIDHAVDITRRIQIVLPGRTGPDGRRPNCFDASAEWMDGIPDLSFFVERTFTLFPVLKVGSDAA
jgi:hypothetical protein